MKLQLFVVALIMCGAYAASAATADQCQAQYNKCKNDIKNIFKQHKCKKARSSCLSQASVEAKQNDMRTQMLNGTAAQPTDMRSQMLGGQQNANNVGTLQGKAAAQQRINMRNQMMAGAQTPPPAPAAVDAKEAARLRILERQKAQQTQTR